MHWTAASRGKPNLHPPKNETNCQIPNFSISLTDQSSCAQGVFYESRSISRRNANHQWSELLQSPFCVPPSRLTVTKPAEVKSCTSPRPTLSFKFNHSPEFNRTRNHLCHWQAAPQVSQLSPASLTCISFLATHRLCSLSKEPVKSPSWKRCFKTSSNKQLPFCFSFQDQLFSPTNTDFPQAFFWSLYYFSSVFWKQRVAFELWCLRSQTHKPITFIILVDSIS